MVDYLDYCKDDVRIQFWEEENWSEINFISSYWGFPLPQQQWCSNSGCWVAAYDSQGQSEGGDWVVQGGERIETEHIGWTWGKNEYSLIITSFLYNQR